MAISAPHPTLLLRALALAAAAGLLPATALALATGESSSYVRVEAFSGYRTSTAPPVGSFLESSDWRETDAPIPAVAGTSQLSMANGASGPISSSAASAWAAPGVAGVVTAVSAAAVANGDTFLLNDSNGRAEATASWWDELLITSPTVSNGSSGMLRAHLVVTGSLLASVGPFFSQSHAAFSVSGVGLAPVGGFNTSSGCAFDAAYCTYASAGGYSGWADGTRVHGSSTIEVNLPFVFGTPFDVGFHVSATSFAQAVSFDGDQNFKQADGLSAFGSTVRWGGIDGIYRGSTLIASYTLASGSGTDFRFAVTTAVPELPPAALLLGGLAAIGWLKRRAAA